MPTFQQPLAVGRSRPRDVHQLLGGLLLGLTLLVLCSSTARAAVDDDYNLALQFYKQERWGLAADKLQSFLKQAPADHDKVPLAKLYLGQALVHQRNFKDARPVFRDFVANYPQQEDLPLAMYRVAECSYFVDDFPAARQELTAFLSRVPPDNPLAEWALQYLGETELQLKDFAAARGAFEKGLKQFPQGRLTEEMQFGLARALEGLDQGDQARLLYGQIAERNGARAADAQFNLAAGLFEDKQYADAARQFEAIGTKYPEHKAVPLATLNAGYSHYHLGEYPQAVKQFAKVRSDVKHGPDAEYWTGLSLKSQEQWDQAAATLLQQFEKDEQQPLAELLLFHAADARLGARNYAEAVRLFRDVHRRWPAGEMADDSLHLATEAAIFAGDFESAREFDEQFAREFPDSGLRLPQDLLSGRLLLAAGDQRAASAGGGDEQAKQNYRQAAEAFTRVLETSRIDETQALARLQLARAWDRLGNHQQVLDTLQPLVEVADNPDAADTARTALAMQSTALLALNKPDESLAAARAFLTRPTTGPEVAEALANVCLSNARRRDWPAIADPLRQLRETGNDALTARVTYEVAEAAYDNAQWEIAETCYQQNVDAGPQHAFYRPSVSGLAYALYEQGQALDEQVRTAEENGNSDVGLLNQTIRKFDAAAKWYTQLAQLSEQQQEPALQSEALFMKGLAQRQARQLPAAVQTLMAAARQFSLPADAADPDADTVKAAYNACRCAKEAARTSQQLEQTEQADAAYQLASEQLQRQPADQQAGLGDLLYEWALLHYNTGDTARSDELLKRFVETDAKNEWADDARLLLAENLYFNDKPEPAREAFAALVDDESTDAFVRERSLVFLMTIASQREDWKDAAARSKTLIEQFPEGQHRDEARYRQAEAALQLKDYQTAESLLTELARRNDDPSLATQEWYPGVWLMLAETHLRQQKYDQVRTLATEFAELHPDSPLAYHLDDVVGRAYKNQAHFDQARTAFQKVIDSPHGKATETAAKAQLYIAETWLAQKNYQKAFEEYYRVLSYGFPAWQSAALYQAGQCEESLKQWQGAAKSYRQLLEEFPESDYADEAQERLEDLQKRFPSTVGS